MTFVYFFLRPVVVQRKNYPNKNGNKKNNKTEITWFFVYGFLQPVIVVDRSKDPDKNLYKQKE